ncbi:glycosyltransferase family 4 protein [Nitrosospira sp. NpAV]|uniref:glycosyltransferase family 4 protein n=1 Tax=Nitrosospira sp. NpAV TaxID=58133 RepID=UPI001E2F8276|nr:glycosyltransferase family 4 protein [Nitrosospira sp. NpAV]
MANQTLQLARLLRAEGATVELIQVNRPYRPHWIGGLKGIRAAFRLVPYLAHLWQSAANVRIFHVMANSGWSWHLFAAPAIWVARIRGIPVIVNYRGGEADAFFDKSFAWIRPSLRRTDAIIVPSGFLERVFGKRGFPTRIVPNIIDLSRFSAETGVAAPLRTSMPHIIVTRNLEPIYDNATVLRAFSIVRQAFPAATLTIAGTGPERQALQKLAAGLGMADAVTFTGRVDNEGMADLYRSADIMVNPSLADNMPISVLEALASGVPVVSTDVGGVPYLVEHGKTALLVPVKDPAAMADAILALLNEPARARQISEAGRASVQQYTWPKVRDRLLAVYEQVLAETGKPLADGKG